MDKLDNTIKAYERLQMDLVILKKTIQQEIYDYQPKNKRCIAFMEMTNRILTKLLSVAYEDIIILKIEKTFIPRKEV